MDRIGVYCDVVNDLRSLLLLLTLEVIFLGRVRDQKSLHRASEQSE